jgi:hypothetical protein
MTGSSNSSAMTITTKKNSSLAVRLLLTIVLLLGSLSNAVLASCNEKSTRRLGHNPRGNTLVRVLVACCAFDDTIQTVRFLITYFNIHVCSINLCIYPTFAVQSLSWIVGGGRHDDENAQGQNDEQRHQQPNEHAVQNEK